MTPENRQKLRDLIKRSHIYFDRLSDPETWPTRHEQTFSDISKLTKIEFKQYRESVAVDSAEKPWRDQTRCRAERIATLARNCLAGGKNEAGWRMSLESEILARFTIEVVCRKCRARLWRSEVEATVSASDGFRDSVEKRRKSRTLCFCSSRNRREDPFEQGVNPLFDDRAEEAIIHEDPLNSEMPKRGKPDRIYGLKMTKKLERLLLWTEDKRPSSGGKFIGDAIRSSPFCQDVEPLLFPFLVLEAKSEKGRDGFVHAEVQTAMTIRTLLKLQEDLRKSTGRESDWETGPLVWFLSNRGEQWRVAAAYVVHRGEFRHYHVVDLWDGRIISNDGALRLLLIVDYIFDWARDIYREAIIGELSKLAVNNTPSLAKDSDLSSAIDLIDFRAQDIETKGTDVPRERENKVQARIQDAFQALDTPDGVFRDAKYIRSSLVALYVTEDNLSMLMDSTDTVGRSQILGHNILTSLRRSWRVTREALDELELMWTGKDREDISLSSPDTIFCVVISTTAYLSSSWEQVRELCYLAVSEAAIRALLLHVNLVKHVTFDPLHSPMVEKSIFLGFFEACLNTSMKENFKATISRSRRSSVRFDQKVRKESSADATGTLSVEEVEEGVKHLMSAGMVLDWNGEACKEVHSVYLRHKIGRSEPSSPFLRISYRWDEQDRDTESHTLSEPNSLDIGGQKIVFIVSEKSTSMVVRPELCIFFLEEPCKLFPKSEELLKLILYWQFRAPERCNRKSTSSGCNIKDLKTQDDRLPEMIQNLKAGLEKKDLPCLRNAMDLIDEAYQPRITSLRLGELRPAASDVALEGLGPATFEYIFDLQRDMLSAAKRVTSMIYFCSNVQEGSLLSIQQFQLKSRISPNSGPTSPIESADQNADIAKAKSGKNKVVDVETGSTPITEATYQLPGKYRGWGLLPRKRAFDDAGGSLSLTEASSKRKDLKLNFEFEDDSLSQEDLDLLLSEGYFN